MKFAAIVAFLLDLSKAKFFGDVTIRYRDGRIVLITKVQTFTDSLPVNPKAVELLETAGVVDATVTAGK